MTSPNTFFRESLICNILSNEFLDVMENTMRYPSTPTDAVLDNRE